MWPKVSHHSQKHPMGNSCTENLKYLVREQDIVIIDLDW